MLTPPGLKGKQYRVTGTAYPRLSRPRRRGRHILFAIVGVLTLAVLGWGTVQLFGVFGGGKKATAAAACRHKAAAGDAVQPSASAGHSSAAASPSASAAGSAAAKSAPAGSAAAGSAAAVPGGVPQPSTITVNVYNATNRTGLASQTAALLKQRGFLIGKIGNAPAALQNKLTSSAQITGGSSSSALMTVVGSEVAGAKPVIDQRKDASVDLVIGNAFTALSTPAQAAQALAQAISPSPAASAAPGHC